MQYLLFAHVNVETKEPFSVLKPKFYAQFIRIAYGLYLAELQEDKEEKDRYSP